MRVEFTNQEMTEAIITKGFWWWKRQALVERYGTQTQYGEYSSWTVDGWRYVITKEMLLGDDCATLNHRIEAIKHEAHEQMVWTKPGIPPARLLKG